MNRRSLHSPPWIAALLLGVGLAAALPAGPADARTADECAMKWSMAARSYLTKNRTQGPEDAEFRGACVLESSDKATARVEAVATAVRSLAKLDPAGCERFLQSYVASKKPREICAAATGGDFEALKKLIADNIPPRK